MASVWQSTSRRFLIRLVVGLLMVSLPVTALVVLVITNQAESNLNYLSQQRLSGRSIAAADRIERWADERKNNVRGLASVIPANLPKEQAQPVFQASLRAFPSFVSIAMLDLQGRPIVATDDSAVAGLAGQDWFQRTAAGETLVSPITLVQGAPGGVRWFVATPVRGADNKPAAVIVADLSGADLRPLLGRPDDVTKAVTILIDNQRRLIASSDFVPIGQRLTARDLVARGALRTTVDSGAVTRALAGQSGTDRESADGRDEYTGYAPLPTLQWAAISRADAKVALAPIAQQRRVGALLLLLAAVILGTFAYLYGRNEAAALLGQNRANSVRVNDSANDLSSASEELAATTAEQTTAVAESSATLEELARTSKSIADTVDRVAAQAQETSENLGEAEHDIRATGERTVALARKVDDIGGILELINEIADQTNLLALNAAIEAARAGEEGRGFAVVAEEVRRLAERSKASAADISEIVDGVQAETNATVMSMEKGARQMQDGLSLLEHVTGAAEQVRLTTQQQRLATEQAVETMEQLTSSSRQVSATAQQIAAAATSLAALATSLEGSRSPAAEHFRRAQASQRQEQARADSEGRVLTGPRE
jgi:hypothetical protein